MGSLPDETQTNLGLLTGLNTQLQAATQALGQAQSTGLYRVASFLARSRMEERAIRDKPQALDQQLAQMQDHWRLYKRLHR